MNSIKRLFAVVVLLLLAVAAYYIYDQFRERTVSERIADVIHIEDSRVLSDALKNYLKDPDPEVRSRAAMAVGRIGGNGSGALLFDLIKSDNIDVATSAAFAIGLTGEKSYAAKLLDIGFDAPARVGQMLVASAGRLADSTMLETINLLTTYLEHPSPEVRSEACMALFRANAKAEAPTLIQFIKQEQYDEVKQTALYALARMRIKAAFDVYESFLADSDPYVRSLALLGMGALDSKEALQYLMIGLNDADEKVVAQAIASLARKDKKEVKAKLIGKLERERDEKLRLDLINALTRLKADGAVALVKDILTEPPSDNITAAAVSYLATIEKEKATILIDSIATLKSPYLRSAAADGYGLIGNDKVIPRLATLFSDNDQTVRANAFGYLMTIDSSNIDYYLDKALADSSYMLNILAIDQINEKKLHKYLPRLLELSNQKPKPDFDIRRTLVDAAGGFLGENKDDTLALKLLINGSLDKDYIICKEAVAFYKSIFDEDRSNMIPPAHTRISRGQIESALEKYKTNPYAVIVTSKGEIEMELFFDVAPLTVLNFIDLAKKGYYENIIFHRVVSNFVIQGGDPEGTGWGGPGYNIRCEYSSEPYIRGTVGIATSGKDTGGSQFFITHTPTPHLEGRYTVMGQVLSGMEVVDEIVRGDTIKEITIKESPAL